MTGTRNQTLDILKGIAIVLVVLGHSIQFNQIDDFDSSFIFRVIYSIHMPLFMFLSGFVSYKTFDGSKEKLYKRFKSLIIPFWAWFVFSFVFSCLMFLLRGGIVPDFFYSFKEIVKSPDTGLWFLWVLFQNYLILFFSLKLSSYREEFFIFMFFILINVFSSISGFGYLGIGLLKWHLLFYMLGYITNKHMDRLTPALNVLGVISLLVFPLLVPFWNRTSNPSFCDSLECSKMVSSVICMAYKFIVPISGILGVYVFFSRMINYNFWFKKMFLKLGTLSLEIYSTHFYFFSFTFLIAFLPLVFREVVTFFVAIFGSVLIQYFVKKVRVLSVLFYGK